MSIMTAICVAATLLATPLPPPPIDKLAPEIGARDAKVFDGYNPCDPPVFTGTGRLLTPSLAYAHSSLLSRQHDKNPDRRKISFEKRKLFKYKVITTANLSQSVLHSSSTFCRYLIVR